MGSRHAGDFHENNFDLVRLFAATQVALAHGVYYLSRSHIEHVHFNAFNFHIFPFHFLKDFPGVPIFFVISGFLISASFENSRSTVNYLRNRFLRIYPALWACLLFSVFVVLCFHVPVTLLQLLKWLGAHLTFLQFYNPAFLRDFGIGTAGGGFDGQGALNGSLWTIPIELQFYCVFPLLFIGLQRVLRRKPGRVAPVAVFAFFLFVAALVHVGAFEPLLQKLTFTGIGLREIAFIFNETFLPHIYLFLFGWVLRRNFDRLRPIFAGKGFYWLAAYIGYLMTLQVVSGVQHVTEVFRLQEPLNVLPLELLTRLFLGCVAVSFAYTLPTLAGKLLRGNDISYGVYIFHMVLINVFFALGWHGTSYGWDVLLLAATYTIALISWFFIEKPALSLKKQTIRTATDGTGGVNNS